MSESVKSPGKNPFLINLDGEIVTLPGKSLESMMGMFAHLESLALRHSKKGGHAAGGASANKNATPLPKYQPFDSGEAERISYRELGRQVIRTAQGQVRVLQQRTQEIQSLVLINSWKVADVLWGELLPSCKTPLFELNFIEELWGINPDKWEINGWSLARHWQQFVLIQAEIEVLLARRQSLVELSDMLEGHLGLWLKRFGEILQKLDETALFNFFHAATHKRWLALGVCLLAAHLTTGCKTVSTSLPPAIQDFRPSYKPSNVYRRSLGMPAEVRRVALLPLTTTVSTDVLDSGVETLEPLVYSELEKAKRFEVIPVTRDQLKQWTGQTGWRSDEPLPRDLFAKVAQVTGCDAVFFCQLTRYQPYSPLAIGWKFSLVQNPKDSEIPEEFHAQIIWSVDEVLDAGEPTVATGARLYYSQHVRTDAASADPATILNSPTRFGQYTLGTLLGTLPERGEKPR